MIILIRITPNASGYRLALFFARASPVTTSSRKTARRNHRESLALSSCFISQSVGARQDTEMGSLVEHSAPLAGSIKMAKFQGVCFILDYIPRGQEPLSRWNVIFFSSFGCIESATRITMDSVSVNSSPKYSGISGACGLRSLESGMWT